MRKLPAARVDKVAPSQQNWLNKVSRVKNGTDRVSYEHSLYSDAHITGEFRTTQGPYTFLNTIPMPTNDGAVKVPIVLRSEMYIEFSIPDMTKTDESVYHGGDLVDEIVAIASLSLGVRLLNGGTSREFGTDDDPYGRPREWTRIPAPVFRFRRDMPIIPAVGGTHSMEALKRLETIPRIEPRQYVSLVRACKAYQEALWICESEPNLAWLLFVSALETAANDVYRAAAPSSERLRTAKPELAKHLMEIGGREHLGKRCRRNRRYTQVNQEIYRLRNEIRTEGTKSKGTPNGARPKARLEKAKSEEGTEQGLPIPLESTARRSALSGPDVRTAFPNEGERTGVRSPTAW